VAVICWWRVLDLDTRDTKRLPVTAAAHADGEHPPPPPHPPGDPASILKNIGIKPKHRLNAGTETMPGRVPRTVAPRSPTPSNSRSSRLWTDAAGCPAVRLQAFGATRPRRQHAAGHNAFQAPHQLSDVKPRPKTKHQLSLDAPHDLRGPTRWPSSRRASSLSWATRIPFRPAVRARMATTTTLRAHHRWADADQPCAGPQAREHPPVSQHRSESTYANPPRSGPASDCVTSTTKQKKKRADPQGERAVDGHDSGQCQRLRSAVGAPSRSNATGGQDERWRLPKGYTTNLTSGPRRS